MIPQENKLLQLLSNNDVTFFIPPYQRNYEWTEEQCQVFWNDVQKTCINNQNGIQTEHFFGSVTYFKDDTPFGQPDKLVLIDGQQRITTTMLFLIALRDIIKDEKLKVFIDTKYLKNNNMTDESEYKIKLKQVETDWVAYKNIVLGEEPTENEKNSAVCRNYKYFYNKLLQYQSEENNIGELIDKGINKFSVITIELQPSKNAWENPQEIFESMNSLGKPLSLADLVRNYLLLGETAATQTELYNKYWLVMEKTLPRKVSDFIRDYMQALSMCSYPKATEANFKTLYSRFKEIFKGKDSTNLLKSLSEYSRIYGYIIFDRTTGNSKIDYLLHDFRKINVTTAHSFLLALMREWEMKQFTDDDIIGILEAFRIYIIRKRILSLTMAENKNFPMLVRKINILKGSENKKQKMFEVLAQQESNLRLPNDIEFTRGLEEMNFYNIKFCKFILSLVEESITKNRPGESDEKLQIEHIMPQKLNETWKEALGADSEEIHQKWVHNIGNLTLIRHNQELGQKSFEEKKEIYENKAGLQIARTNITNCKEWNEIAIEKRMTWIISYLVNTVLPIPDSMKRVNNFSVKEKKGLSFLELQLIGLEINFVLEPSITARVVSDKEVEFEGKKWRLSPLTRELQTRRGEVTPSGTYQGAQYWEYDGIKLSEII